MPYYLKRSDDLDKISEMLAKIGEKAEPVAKKALYEGAGIVADEIQKNANHIPTAPFKFVRSGTRLPSPEEKEIVVNAGVGIAKFNGSGSEVNTSVGYKASGYAELKGKLKPVPLIAASINSGTSFMKKQPFFRKAANSGGKKATEAMKGVVETEFEAITKE